MTNGHAIRVKQGEIISLSAVPSTVDPAITKEAAQVRLNELKAEIDVLQEQMFAAGQNSLLVVMQGMDTSGKDGAIRGVFGDTNPAGCRVESFKTPTPEELSHDFLWRVHRVAPARGMITVFNRSHYEDVLIVRVHELVPKSVWSARYEMINLFEQVLHHSQTIILKFFLHISFEEQEKRLLEREQDVEKAWKLAASDWRERQNWNDYQAAYEDALSQCSTVYAPWYIVPADRKWYRNLLIADVVVNTLKGYRKDWDQALEQMSRQRLAELAAYRESLRIQKTAT
jgi:PPK2 family polyphosphate:nucleotide phosphotransferase